MFRASRGQFLAPTATLFLALCIASSCGDGGGELAETATTGQNGVVDAGTKNAKVRELSSLNVCELLPERDIIDLLGGEIKTAASRSDYGNSQGCDYGIGAPGTATYEYISIWVSTPDLFQSAESILETDTGLGQEATAEDLEGLGDVAFAIHNETEQQTTVHVLRRDDVVVSVTAEGLEHARRLTEEVIERLGDE
jgi:hypothetical protein